MIIPNSEVVDSFILVAIIASQLWCTHFWSLMVTRKYFWTLSTKKTQRNHVSCAVFAKTYRNSCQHVFGHTFVIYTYLVQTDKSMD